ncbi:MAG: AAA family ATPase [Saprospiraceae bacterium]
MSEDMGSRQVITIAVTGPESTGKTRLAQELAQSLGVEWVAEYARAYLNDFDRPYVREDLEPIGRGQAEAIALGKSRALRACPPPQPPLLVLDTDWTVLHVWEAYRFGTELPVPYWQRGYGRIEVAGLYLLCYPDIRWEPDPLREHPEERMILFGEYEALLRAYQAPYYVVRGQGDARVRGALAEITKRGLATSI